MIEEHRAFMEVAKAQAGEGMDEGGIPRAVIGENRTFHGAEELLRGRGVEVVVLDDPECAAMVEAFIALNPMLWNEDIGEDAAAR